MHTKFKLQIGEFCFILHVAPIDLSLGTIHTYNQDYEYCTYFSILCPVRRFSLIIMDFVVD